MSRILIIEDDLDTTALLTRFLQRNGYEVSAASTGAKGIAALQQDKFDVVLCDYRLGDMDGKEILKFINQSGQNVKVIIITGYSDVKTAVDVMKNGAFDYVTKPLLPEEILLAVKKAMNAPANEPQASANASATVASKGKRVHAKSSSLKYIEPKGKAASEIYRQTDLVAQTNYSVIIHGESGSGKEYIAWRIHQKSKRADQPFIAVDCGALSKELAASELFGHEKGSFTGAINTKTGCFELAQGGTIFLDEIANLSYDIQVALLRVVQERKLKKIGSEKEIPIDVRIIVASNEKLEEAVAKGKFREDLFYRFNEFGINLPALRERKDDLMQFADFFLENACESLGKEMKGFEPEVIAAFNQYNWPGNLRELNNVVKRSALLSPGDTVELSGLPPEIVHYKKFNPSDDEPTTTEKLSIQKDFGNGDIKKAALNAEFELIMDTLQKVQFNKSKAAKLLNIDRKTLYNKMNAYGILAEGD